MHVHRYGSPTAFLDDAESFLLQAEVENNLILGVARKIAGGPSGGIEPYFVTIQDQSGVCVAAFQNIPTKLGLTQARRADALPLLAADVHVACPMVRDVLGPEPTVGTFAKELASLRHARVECGMRQRIYELRRVLPLGRQPSGHLRLAAQSEAELLAEWAGGFLEDVKERGDPGSIIQERLANDQLYLWDDDGPRSMAAWTGKTPNGVRVNFVYTPGPWRGRGYATAVVAALCQRLLDHGNHHCCLYTDLANPTSNAIYQRIGFSPVTEAAVYEVGV